MADALAVIAGGILAGLVGLLTVRHERRLDRRLRIFEELVPTIIAEVEAQAAHDRLASSELRTAVLETTRAGRVAGWDEYQAAVELRRLIDEREELMLKVGDRIGSNPVVIQVKQTADPGLLELVKERNALISAQAASLGTLVERRIIPRRSLGSRLRGTRIGRGLSNARTESKYRRLRGESRDKSK